MSAEETWNRGKDALEKMLNFESIETIEALAEMLQDEKFRKSYKYGIVKSELKPYINKKNGN